MMRGAMRAVIVAVLACMVFVLAGCSRYPSAQQAIDNLTPKATVSAGATITPGVLTIGINKNSAPYCWETGDSAVTIRGYDVDIAIALADHMGLTARFVNVGTNVEAAANGVCDVVMSVQPSQIASGSEVVVGSYIEFAPAIFARVGTGVSIDQLAVSLIAIQADSASARAIGSITPTAVLMPYPTLNDAFKALKAGTVGYVACDSVMGGYLASSYDDIQFMGALSMPEVRGVAVPTANAELQAAVQQALDAISADGEQYSIRTKWFGALPIVTAANQIVPVV